MTNNKPSCPPVGPPPSINDPCAVLGELRAAYLALLTGSQRHRVRFQEREVTYHPGNLELLRAEVRRLERICPKSAANPYGGRNNAMRAGPYLPATIATPSPAFFGRPRNPFRW